MDFPPPGTSSIPLLQNSSRNVTGTDICNHSTTSSASTTSHDKKPRAKETTYNETATRADVRFTCDRPEHSIIGTNPFMATTLIERNENFPSFDQAFLDASGDNFHENRSIGGMNAMNLSISALAALSEHNRHVSRYGIDNSVVQDQGDDDDENFPQSLFADPLDVEWERLLLNTSTNDSATNVSRISLNQSIVSAPEQHSISTEKIRITTTRSPDGVENDAIEVMTEVSYSDFLNTSRMINILRTPEHVRAQERANMFPSYDNDGVTTRAQQRQNRSCSNETSEASFSDDSIRKLQKMYSNAMLPPNVKQQQPINDSSSMTSTPSRNSKSIYKGHIPSSSFSLQNVDLSRISADDDDDSGIIRSLDHSFGTATSANDNNNNVLPSLIDHFDIGIHLDNDQTPSMSNNKSRKSIRKDKFEEYSEPWSTHPTEQTQWRHSTKKSTFSPSHSPSNFTKSDTHNNTAISSPSRDPQHVSIVSERSHSILIKHPIQEDKHDDEIIDNKLEMMGLSPVSRKAADRAISLLQSSPDWNSSKGALFIHNERSSYPNPFSAEPESEFFHGTNDTSSESRLYDSNHGTYNVINYEQHSGSASSGNQLHFSNEDGISPLPSISEPNNTTDSSNSGIMHNNSGTEAIIGTMHNNSGTETVIDRPFENSSSSDDHLKKNSLSSISPNSSSEHHITTKPTAATNSSSSYSATSNNSNKSTSLPAHPDNLTAMKKSDHPQSAADGANMIHDSLPIWDDQNDRRRYRTVVPIRVFMNEPYNFPNEDDSFTNLRKTGSMTISVSSLPTTSTKIRYQNHDRLEQSI